MDIAIYTKMPSGISLRAKYLLWRDNAVAYQISVILQIQLQRNQVLRRSPYPYRNTCTDRDGRRI